VGQIGDDFYVVSELIDGRSLADLITATGLSMETVSRYGTQIADAVPHAHLRGTAHRDPKGSNVMVTAEGRVKVLDFAWPHGLSARRSRLSPPSAADETALNWPGQTDSPSGPSCWS